MTLEEQSALFLKIGNVPVEPDPVLREQFEETLRSWRMHRDGCITCSIWADGYDDCPPSCNSGKKLTEQYCQFYKFSSDRYWGRGFVH